MQSLSWRLANYILQTIQQNNKALRKKNAPFCIILFLMMMSVKRSAVRKINCPLVWFWLFCCCWWPASAAINEFHEFHEYSQNCSHVIRVQNQYSHDEAACKVQQCKLICWPVWQDSRPPLSSHLTPSLILSAFSSAWCPWYPQVLHNDGAQRF